MSDDIGFEDMPDKETSEITNERTDKMRNDAINKLDKNTIDKQVRAEHGLVDVPPEPEAVPEEAVKFAFDLLARATKCQLVKLTKDDDVNEAKVLAKHISILTGSVNSKIFSVFIVGAIVGGKIINLTECIRRKRGEISAAYDEKTESVKSGVDKFKGKVFGDD